MKLIPNAVSNKFGRQLLQVQKASPQLLFYGGIAGVVTSAVLTARATLKLSDTLQKGEDLTQLAHTKHEAGEYAEEKTYTKDLTVIKIRTALDVARLYALPVAVGTLSIAALTGSHVTLNRRNAGLAAAYTAVDKAFEEYRSRVRDELGDDQDRNFRYGVERTETVVKGKGDKPDKIMITETVPVGMPSQYAKFFDEGNPEWRPNAEYNMIFLRARQGFLNDLLQSRGHVMLNDVYDQLGMERTGAGCVVGWVLGSGGDDFIDFGLYDGPNKDRVRAFVNGQEDAILLDFNVDGLVYDKIG